MIVIAHLAARVDKMKRIAVGVGQLRDLLKHRVRSDPSKPILGVAEVTLAAVHDAVPKTPLGAIDVLANRVAAVEVAGQQPETADTGSMATRWRVAEQSSRVTRA